MKVLIVHNQYQHRGGEDVVVEAESQILADHGHDVHKYFVSNKSISSVFSKIAVLFNLVYSRSAKRKFKDYLEFVKPDIVHFHNLFPLLTPSIIDACHELRIPCVMTLHNYRLICPSAMLLHNNVVYEKSVKYGAMSTVRDKVYKNSYLATWALARMISYHRKNQTWSKKLNKVICLTNFQKSKFKEAGFDTSNFVVKPNFSFNRNSRPEFPRLNQALFVGRLSHEKGVLCLIKAFSELDIALNIVGSGPLESLMVDLPSNINYMGALNSSNVYKEMLKSKLLIMPSLWYEGFPMVLVEALSCGLPVVCSDIGSMSEIIRDGYTGRHFIAGNKDSLKRAVHSLFNNQGLLDDMSQQASSEFLHKYSPQENYTSLMSIYNSANG